MPMSHPKIHHVIMYREVGPDFRVQAVCPCGWEGETYRRFTDADTEGDQHLKQYERFPRLTTPD